MQVEALMQDSAEMMEDPDDKPEQLDAKARDTPEETEGSPEVILAVENKLQMIWKPNNSAGMKLIIRRKKKKRTWEWTFLISFRVTKSALCSLVR